MKCRVFLLYFLLLITAPVGSQVPTSFFLLQRDSTAYTGFYHNKQADIIKNNQFINTGLPSYRYAGDEIKYNNRENVIFYLLTGLVLILGIIKLVFRKYFSILFRVFFNTSLRQSQLTDQLLMTKLPSLTFNLFFIITAGLYIYFIFNFYGWINPNNIGENILFSILAIAVVYGIKFFSLKFIGWISGYTTTVDSYIFIIFLINKILGVLLVPFVITIAFADAYLAKVAILLSGLLISLLFILRFVRGYGALKDNVKISRYHFFLYFLGFEIMPLLLVYKAVLIFLIKNS